MKWTKCAIRFLRISRPGVRVPSIAPRKTSTRCVLVFLFVCTMEGARTRRRRPAPQAISPVQQRRPQPAAETGRSCWGRVLIFQSPAKGLRKNQQTQPIQAPAVRFRQGSQRLGMSTGMTAVLWWAVQGESRNEQRQGITMVVVSCLLL